MCSGCSTCGNRTRFGSGNNRATPEKCSGCNKKSSSDAAIISTQTGDQRRRQRLPPETQHPASAESWHSLRRQNCTLRQLVRRRRIEVNLRNRVGHDVNLRKRLLTGHDLGETFVQLRQEPVEVEPHMFW